MSATLNLNTLLAVPLAPLAGAIVAGFFGTLEYVLEEGPQSQCSSSAKFGLSKSHSNHTPMVMPMPGTMLMKNSQCHDIKSVM